MRIALGVILIWPTTEEFRQAVLENGDYSAFPAPMLAYAAFQHHKSADLGSAPEGAQPH